MLPSSSLAAAQPYVEALVKERFGPEQLKELAMNNIAAMYELGKGVEI